MCLKKKRCVKFTSWNGLRESPPCFEFFFDHLRQDTSWEQVCFTAPQPCKYGVPETLGLKLLVQRMSTRRQHFSMPHPGSSGDQSPGEKCSRLADDRTVPGAGPICLPPYLHPQTPQSPAWAACTFLLGPSLCCCPGWLVAWVGQDCLWLVLMDRTGLGAHWLDHDSCERAVVRSSPSGSWLAGAPGSWGAHRVGVVLLGRWSCRNAGPARGEEGARKQSPSALLSLEVHQRLASLAQVLNVGSNLLPV